MKGLDKTLEVQMQIRQNAEEISSALREIKGWEKAAKQKDLTLQRKATTSKAKERVRSAGGTVPIRSTLAADSDASPTSDPAVMTPASIVDTVVKATPTAAAAVPTALGTYEHKDLEELERERGNGEFKTGNFASAVKCYTKCLGLKTQNYVAFSNRAMAYLKLKEFSRAVADCSCALSIEPAHVKSLLRRATAFTALGKLRAALSDLKAALLLEPTNKQARADVALVREQLRNAVARAPMVSVPSFSVLVATPTGVMAGTDCGIDPNEAAALAMQGPDPIPEALRREEARSAAVDITLANAQPLSPTAAPLEPLVEPLVELQRVGEEQGEQEYHRIAVTFSDDEGADEEEAIPINRLAEQLEISQPALTKTVTPKKASTSKKAKGKAKASKISGAYELEKELLRLQHDVVATKELLAGLASTVGRVMRDAVEPEALRLLLQAVLRVHRHDPTGLSAAQVVGWFEAARQLPNFSLLHSLLPAEHAVNIATGLRAAVETAVVSAELARAYRLWKP